MASSEIAKGLSIPEPDELAGVSEIRHIRIPDHAARNDAHVRAHIGPGERPAANRVPLAGPVFAFQVPQGNIQVVAGPKIEKLLNDLLPSP